MSASRTSASIFASALWSAPTERVRIWSSTARTPRTPRAVRTASARWRRLTTLPRRTTSPSSWHSTAISATSTCGASASASTIRPRSARSDKGLVMNQLPEALAQLAELRLDLLDGRLVTLVAQLLAGLHARLARGLLGSGDLGLDVLADVAHDAAVEGGDRAVHGPRPALADVGDHGRLAIADRARDVLEHAVGLVVVFGVDDGSGQQAHGSTEQDAERTREDPDQQPDRAAGERCEALVLVARVVVQMQRPVLGALDDRAVVQVDLAVDCELLEARKGLVRPALFAEGGDNDVLVHGPSMRRRRRRAIRRGAAAISAASHAARLIDVRSRRCQNLARPSAWPRPPPGASCGSSPSSPRAPSASI